MKTPLNIAIIIAIKEEFKTIDKLCKFVPTKEIDSTYGEWYEWIDCLPETCHEKIYVTFIGNPTSIEAVRFTTRFLEHYAPKILVNFGVSGTLSDDVRLGDLVIPELTDLYEYNCAIVEKDGVSIQPSGKPFKTDYFKRLIDNLEFQHRLLFTKWENVCSTARKKLIEPIQKNVPQNLLGPKTSIHTGRLACICGVSKTVSYKDLLLAKDRKYLAVDMESGGIAFSCENESSKVLIIRAISDPSDERKRLLDNLGKEDPGAFRKWALENGINFLKIFLDIIISRPSCASSQETYLRNSLVPEVVDIYHKKGIGGIYAFETFFRNYMQAKGLGNIFYSLLEEVEATSNLSSSLASITGFPGTGKSTFLSCLYFCQRERFEKGLTEYFPHYINISNYLADGCRPEDASEQFRVDIRNIFEKETKDNRKICLIIDGCNDYYRDSGLIHFDQELKRILTAGIYNNVVKLIGVGILEPSFLEEERISKILSWAQRENILFLKRVRTDTSIANQIISDYAHLKDGDHDKLANQICATIKSLKIPELDLFVLSLLERAIKRGLKFHNIGIGSLYYEYCADRIQSQNNRPKNDEAVRKEIHLLSKEFFDLYVKRERQPLCDDSSISGIGINTMAISFAHPSIKEFLIAEHVVESIISGNICNDTQLDYIYPYGINRFIKSIINRSVDSQRVMFNAIKNLYNNASLSQKTHLCYLLGRFDDRSIKMNAIKLLEELLSAGKSSSLSKLKSEKVEFRRWLLLQRTIYISQTYLGDSEASSQYLKLLLEHADWDALNRGFHLEYYEDFSPSPTPGKMISFDDISYSPKKTFEVLSEKIFHDCEAENPRPIRPIMMIELHTLLSLCVNRHLSGKLNEDKRRKIVQLLEIIINHKKIVLPSFYRSYVEMAYDVLNREYVSPGKLISELFNLKTTLRSGWNARKEVNGVNIQRNCNSPESVADHTFGCLLIGEAFLPENSSEKGYSKAEILRMLLIHDLAEAYQGDKENFKKTEQDIQEEDKLMQRISALGKTPIFSGMENWGKSWQSFAHNSSINAQIALDIDKIEACVQLIKYSHEKDNAIPDAEDWVSNTAKDLQTAMGRHIFNLLVWGSHEKRLQLKTLKATMSQNN